MHYSSVFISLLILTTSQSFAQDEVEPAPPAQSAPDQPAASVDQNAPAQTQQQPVDMPVQDAGNEAVTIQQVPMTIPVPIPIPQGGAPASAPTPSQATSPGGQLYTPNLPSPNVIDTNENSPPPSATITIPRNAPVPELTESEKKAQALRARDDRLENLIRTKIYQDNASFAKTVTIDVTGGKVLLQGQVLDSQDKLLIERTAKKEAGATNVINQLVTIKE